MANLQLECQSQFVNATQTAVQCQTDITSQLTILQVGLLVLIGLGSWKLYKFSSVHLKPLFSFKEEADDDKNDGGS